MKPLSYPLRRLLLHIERNPGLSRSELGKALYEEMNPYYSLRKVSKMCKVLEERTLIEYDVIHEGGRFGVPGVYLKGKVTKTDGCTIGVFGRKEGT